MEKYFAWIAKRKRKMEINESDLIDIAIALEKSFRILSTEGYNEDYIRPIKKKRDWLRELLGIQRIKCDFPLDHWIIFKDGRKVKGT